MGNLPSFSRDVRDFISLLIKHEVRYVLIGGAAVIYYGYPRYTGDVDFYYAIDIDNARKLTAALREFWGESIQQQFSEQDFLEPGQMLQFGVPPHRIDLINRIDGISFDEVWADKVAEQIEINGVKHEIFLISKTNLRKNKSASRRNKDLDDLTKL